MYLGLSLALVAVAVVVAAWGGLRVQPGEARRRHWAAVGIGAGVVIVLTAIFDNVIIAMGIVDYDPAKISGVRVGLAPLEDFSYAIACSLALPGMWVLLRKEGRSADG